MRTLCADIAAPWLPCRLRRTLNSSALWHIT